MDKKTFVSALILSVALAALATFLVCCSRAEPAKAGRLVVLDWTNDAGNRIYLVRDTGTGTDFLFCHTGHICQVQTGG